MTWFLLLNPVDPNYKTQVSVLKNKKDKAQFNPKTDKITSKSRKPTNLASSAPTMNKCTNKKRCTQQKRQQNAIEESATNSWTTVSVWRGNYCPEQGLTGLLHFLMLSNFRGRHSVGHLFIILRRKKKIAMHAVPALSHNNICPRQSKTDQHK